MTIKHFLLGFAVGLVVIYLISLILFTTSVVSVPFDRNIPMGGTNDEMREYMYSHVTPGQGTFTYPPM